MSVMVRKSSSVVVTASEPVTVISGAIKLSSFDKGLMNVPVTAIFIFEHPIQDVADTIQVALSKALVHYYPISGRIASGVDGSEEAHIQCTSDGVVFVDASADCALKELEFNLVSGGRKLLDEVSVSYPDEGCRADDPLMMMQVTKFSCGGFIVGVTWNHAIADGFGMAQFLQAVGEIARGLPTPSVAPVRQQDSLPNIPMSSVALQRLCFSLDPMDLVWQDVTIPLGRINSIREEYGISSGGQSCTLFEVVTAVLWQCRTKVTMSDPEAPAVLVFSANLRKHVGAVNGYYGNCLSGQVIMAMSDTIANGDVNDVIKMIKHAKDQIPDKFKKREAMSQAQETTGQLKLDYQPRYNMMAVSSWHNLGFEELDFGSGNLARMVGKAPSPMPICLYLPWKETVGAHVLSCCVKMEHADAFLSELA